MSALSIELLTPERATELWPALESYFDAACKANDFAVQEMDSKDIYLLAATGLLAIFVGFEDGEPACVVGLQFTETNGHKGADVVAMAGRGLMRFKAAYWEIILQWLRVNKVEFLDAYASERLAKVYLSRFGFNKSCVYVRQTL